MLVVSDEALEIADAEGLNFFPHQAAAFAVIFLRANASRDSGKHVVFTNLGGGPQEIAGNDQLHELTNLHAYRAFVRASRLGAFKTTQRLLAGQFGRVTQVDFSEVGGPQLRQLLGHMLPGHFHALF